MDEPTSPLDMRNLYELLEQASRLWPARTAIVADETGESISFTDLRERVDRVADHLSKRGVAEGARVVLMLSNGIQYPVYWLALARLGAVMVPANTFSTAAELAFLITHSQAVLTVADARLHKIASEAVANSSGPCDVVSVDEFDSAGEVHRHGITFTTAAEPASIQYTSGSSGKPKGCVLSHAYWLRLAWKLTTQFPHITANDVIITAQPFYYIDPQVCLVTALASGSRLIVLDRFHPSSIWDRIRQHQATFMYCVGVMPTMMLNTVPSPQDRDHSLRLVMCSGLPRHLHRQVEDRWGVPWHEAFGMTETGSDTFMPYDEQASMIGSGSIGRPYSDRQVEVRGPDGTPLLSGQTGAMWLRGPGMMTEYFRDPQATEEAFSDGWYHTGDLASIDQSGLIYFRGRSKDIIRRSGENISAPELEQALEQHPTVGIAACVPVPDPIRGEETMAFITASTPEETLDLNELVEFLTARVSYYKVPRYWKCLGRMPLTPSGKVNKPVLRDQVHDVDLEVEPKRADRKP